MPLQVSLKNPTSNRERQVLKQFGIEWFLFNHRIEGPARATHPLVGTHDTIGESVAEGDLRHWRWDDINLNVPD
jgi:hypothetical protein